MTHPPARIRKASILARTWQIAGGDAATLREALEADDRATLDLLVRTASARMNQRWHDASPETWELVLIRLDTDETFDRSRQRGSVCP